MKHPRVLAIHKQEWKRLKKQGYLQKNQESVNEKCKNDKTIELSQQWIKKSPESKQNHKDNLSNKLAVENFLILKRKDNRIEIDKAKNMIFEQCSYGRELLSAIIESKTLEERDAQIVLLKEIKERELKNDNELGLREINGSSYFNDDKDKISVQREIKRKNKEIADINKLTFKLNTLIKIDDKKNESQFEIEDSRIMNKLLEYEKTQKDVCKENYWRDFKDFEKLQKEISEKKVERENKDDCITTVWKNYNDRIRCGERKVFNEIFRDKYLSKKSIDNYNLLAKVLKEEESRYNDFIQKGMETKAIRELNDLNTEKEDAFKKRATAICISEHNKTMGENSRFLQNKNNKCFCDKQSLFTKACDDYKKKAATRIIDDHKFVLPLPTSKLEELKTRALEPSPWSGTRASHKLYADRATEAFKESHYKRPVIKAVENYLKNNCISAKQLSLDKQLLPPYSN